MCCYPLAGEPTKIYHPTTTNAGLSYFYTALVRRTDCDRPLYLKKERSSLKLEKPYLREGSASFGQCYVKLKFWTRLKYKWLDNSKSLPCLTGFHSVIVSCEGRDFTFARCL